MFVLIYVHKCYIEYILRRKTLYKLLYRENRKILYVEEWEYKKKMNWGISGGALAGIDFTMIKIIYDEGRLK